MGVDLYKALHLVKTKRREKIVSDGDGGWGIGD